MPAAAGAPLTDKFLGPFWRLVAPAGGSASISNSHLFIAVPGGSNHDTLVPANQAVRVVQTIGNEDFDVAIKIDFPMVATEGDTSQGLMVLSDDEDFVTFALVTDGSSIGLRARTVTHGAGSDVLNDMGFSQYQNPMYLRLTRSKSNYVAFYSIDGVGWNEAASFSYARGFHRGWSLRQQLERRACECLSCPYVGELVRRSTAVRQGLSYKKGAYTSK